MGQPERAYNTFACFGMSADPFHPQGFGQHSTAMPGRHLGRRIKFDELPKDCQRAIVQGLGSCSNCGRFTDNDDGVCAHTACQRRVAYKNKILASWQADYTKATGNRGKVISADGNLDGYGNLEIQVTVNWSGNRRAMFIPYRDPLPFDDCQNENGGTCIGGDYDHICSGHDFESDQYEWLDNMNSATNWGEGDWGDATIIQ